MLIQSLFDLKNIKELLEIVKHTTPTLQLMKDQQSVMNQKLDAIVKDLESVKDNQKDHTRRLEAVSGDTEQLLNDVKGIRDEIGLWHGREKREINEIKKLNKGKGFENVRYLGLERDESGQFQQFKHDFSGVTADKSNNI